MTVLDHAAMQQTATWWPTATAPLYNPLLPSFRRDPYPQYANLRAIDPVHWSPYGWCWVLTRYDDVKTVLFDKRFGIALDWLEQIEALKPVFAEPFNRIIRTQILAADPPAHPRIRKVMARWFTVSFVDTLRASIQARVDAIVDRVLPNRRMDVMAELAYPLPFNVVCDLLGIPDPERAPLEAFTHHLMRTTDPTPMSRLELDQANDAAIGFRDYFLVHAARARRERMDNVFQDMLDAWDAGTLDEEEFVANLILVFCAGHDTVVNLFGNGLLALHRNPDQLALLKAEPRHMKTAIEELLRYDTPLHVARRTALEDVPLRGKVLRRGDYVVCSLGAANRDPEAFPDPDRLDVTRKDAKTLSFGGGIHYCLGAYLARVQGEIVFETLLRRIPDLRLDTLDPPFHQNTFLRGLETLPASW